MKNEIPLLQKVSNLQTKNVLFKVNLQTLIKINN